MNFELSSPFSPTGDQPEAIAALSDGIKSGVPFQTLLGVTGSGKTFTIANVIKEVRKPTLILSHNKTLAAQLLQRVQGIFSEQCRRVFCLLLRLLSAGGLSSDDGYLYRKGLADQ